jgi:hypothetical protein
MPTASSLESAVNSGEFVGFALWKDGSQFRASLNVADGGHWSDEVTGATPFEALARLFAPVVAIVPPCPVPLVIPPPPC